MDKKTVDAIVSRMQREEKKREKPFTKKEITDKYTGQYSKDQIDRIYYRYKYISTWEKDSTKN